MRSLFTSAVSKSSRRSLGNILIWDSLAPPKGQDVKLKTRREGVISWYACGPTVYDSAHVGHATSYIRLDIIRRILEHQNYSVLQVMGITDIDDKIIRRANYLNVSWQSLSRKYENEFVQEMKDLNVKEPLARARVSTFIPQIIQFVEKLVSLGFAYPTEDGSVYFDTTAYGKDGKFVPATNYSENEIEAKAEAEAEASKKPKSSSISSPKRNKKDFALWKGSKPNEPFWTTQWGKGRPGWHIECSAIASHYFGNVLDIHSGGCDLIFPHHENEETQCCAYFGIDKWVTHWIHTGHLIMNADVKMSKSLGNTVTISDFLKNNSPNVLRMFCLTNNTRAHLHFTSELLDRAKTDLSTYENFLKDCELICQGIKPITLSEDSAEENLWAKLAEVQNVVERLLCKDFNFTAATILVRKFITEFNNSLQYSASDKHSSSQSKSSSPANFELVLASQKFVQDFFDLMGFQMERERKTIVESDPSSESAIQMQSLLEEFIEFRQKVRYYSLAIDEADKKRRKELIQERQDLVTACDEARSNLSNFGIEIKDHGKNSSWSIKAKQ